MSKILLVTDAWKPQINGVVTTLTNLVAKAKENGDNIYVYHPGKCKLRMPLPIYKEIVIGIPNPVHIYRLLKKQYWDHVHIATPEGPLGLCFILICRKLNIPFSTSCHTKFPEFINARFPWIKTSWGWSFMRYAYKNSVCILTTTPSMVSELKDKGFLQDIRAWSRGVDRTIFYPVEKSPSVEKILLCVSRASHEKGLDDFCKLQIPNTKKILVGDGPYLPELKSKYKDVLFTGSKTGIELAAYYQKADVFVFPSKADTFGIVIIEALACGVPVAAYPVIGPVDIIQSGITGFMDNDLTSAVQNCFTLDKNTIYEHSKVWSWDKCYQQFREILIKINMDADK
jgi:glycosyltransferase involved in cell wall biosynthesis